MKNDASSPMNLAEARMIAAAATRADLASPGPELAAALDVLRSDPAEWTTWTQERQRDQCIASALGGVSPPPGLREQILAVHAAQRRTHPRRRFLLAWAAGLTVMGGVGIAAHWLMGPSSPSVGGGENSLAAASAHFLDREWDHAFELTAGTLGEIQHFLEKSEAAASMDPGKGFEQLATIGCRRFSWRGETAILVCFRTRGDKAVVHVVSVPRTAVGADAAEARSLFREGRWHAASWIRGARAYVALSDQPLDVKEWG